MSFFVDDDEFQESTEFKCSSDPVQRTFRRAVERAIQYVCIQAPRCRRRTRPASRR